MREHRSGLKSSNGVARIAIAGIVAAAFAVLNISAVSASGWAIVGSPNQGGSHNQLYGVACTSSTSCVAVGYYYNGSSVTQTLVETWNGATWSISASPNQGTGANALTGVDCTSSTSCTAVGDYSNGSSIAQTLVETWNGTAWSITPSPSQGTGSNYLDGVACTSATSCVAVGQYTNGSSITQTLAETWNGTAWLITPSPNKSTAFKFLTVWLAPARQAAWQWGTTSTESTRPWSRAGTGPLGRAPPAPTRAREAATSAVWPARARPAAWPWVTTSTVP